MSLVEGFSVTHRRYVPHSHAHYGGNLVDGAYGLGLFAGYDTVAFLAPVQAGDVIEATATLTRIGNRSRRVTFEARVVCRADPERGQSASRVLDPPLVVTTAEGTVVVPA